METPVIDGQLALAQSLETGESLKANGITKVTANEATTWKLAFRDVVRYQAPGTEFTSEDITRQVGQPPHHPNSVGAQMNALARQGVIELVGFNKASRVNQHASRIGVWRRI